MDIKLFLEYDDYNAELLIDKSNKKLKILQYNWQKLKFKYSKHKKRL